ncbi:MAG TPA: hypothetical protein VK783_13470 [Bacteroidia bacterium]|nr:hypothetical protein [Bacteroidia bacterium]
METLEHHNHNLFKILMERIYHMYLRKDHTLGDFLLLYSIIFLGILLFLLTVATAARWFQ